MNRLACAQTPRDTRASHRQRNPTPAASDELTSKFKFESQCGPIPLDGDGPRGASALTFVRNAMLHVLSLLAVLLVGTGSAWAQSGIPHTPAEEKACRDDAHRFCAKTSSPTNSRSHRVCRSTATTSATPAVRLCKATHDSPVDRCYSAALSSAGDPAWNCSNSAASSAFEAARCRCLTWPKPRIFSGMDASATAT